MGSPDSTLSAYRDKQSRERSILEAAKHGPLQSLTDREMDVREQPMSNRDRSVSVRGCGSGPTRCASTRNS